MDFTNLTVGFAFFAGLASFLSPCVFALVPAYVGYLSGRSAAATTAGRDDSSWLTFTHGLAFVGGFTLVFVALGALAGAIGGLLVDITSFLVKAGGIVVVIFGLHMTKIIQIPFLNYDVRKQGGVGEHGYWSSALMGVFFSAGWAPCVGPILGLILTFSLNGGSPLVGGQFLLAYSLGLGIPFLIAATQIGWVTAILRRYGRVMHYVEITMGVILIVLGIMLFTGRYEVLAQQAAIDIAFLTADDEVAAGRVFFIGLLASLILGLIPGYVAKNKGKNFVEWWFLGSGVSLVLLVVLYALGVFNAILPTFS